MRSCGSANALRRYGEPTALGWVQAFCKHCTAPQPHRVHSSALRTRRKPSWSSVFIARRCTRLQAQAVFQAEGRGFESRLPLEKSPDSSGLFFVWRPCSAMSATPKRRRVEISSRNDSFKLSSPRRRRPDSSARPRGPEPRSGHLNPGLLGVRMQR